MTTRYRKKTKNRNFTIETVRSHQIQILALLKKPGWTVDALMKLELYFRTLHENVTKALNEINDTLEKEIESDLTKMEAKKEEPNGEEAA